MSSWGARQTDSSPWFLPARTWRTAFVCFAGAVFIATHWPRLTVPGPGGTDLVAHLVVFSAWTVLLGLTGWCGPRFSVRGVGLGVLIALAYAGVDEGLQAVPILGRTCSWSDYGANALGVALASAGLLVVGWKRRAATSA